MRLFLLGIAILISITACGPRWYYPHLDWLLPWYVDDYISLDADQRGELDRRLAHQLEWHCRTQLPIYAAFLREIKTDFETADTPLTRDHFHRYYTMLGTYWQSLVHRIGPDVADILMTADEQQLEAFFVNIEARNRELESTYVDPPAETIYADRYERMRERLEEWVGDLSIAQQAAIQAWSQRLGTTGDQWLADRRNLQLVFRRILAHRQDSTRYRQDFMILLTQPDAHRTEAAIARRDRRTRLTLELLTDIGNTLTPSQRAHLLAHLEGLSRDFDALACRIPPSAPQNAGMGGPIASPQGQFYR